MAKFKHCFIRDNGAYREIPYTTLFIDNERNPEYADRYFLPFNGCLLEVPFEDYRKAHKNKRRQKYIREEAELHCKVSYQALDSEEMTGEEFLRDVDTDVEAEAITSVILSKALQKLTDNERRLITLLYFEDLTERECAEIFEITQKGINKRKHKILGKLKNILES
ncbi:MAG: sigma-70 family RNA polymerase sigma factor [Clostridiaceae bacterium]